MNDKIVYTLCPGCGKPMRMRTRLFRRSADNKPAWVSVSFVCEDGCRVWRTEEYRSIASPAAEQDSRTRLAGIAYDARNLEDDFREQAIKQAAARAAKRWNGKDRAGTDTWVVRTGHWEPSAIFGEGTLFCSNCLHLSPYDRPYNHCPYCGAKMTNGGDVADDDDGVRKEPKGGLAR